MEYTETQIDALSEIINIGVGRAASSLSELIGERIELSVPEVRIGRLEETTHRFTEVHQSMDTAVIQDFSGQLEGRAMLAFPKESSVRLGQILLGIDDPSCDLSEDISGALEEIGNIVINAVLGSISNVTSLDLYYSVPRLSVGQAVETILSSSPSQRPTDERVLLVADTRFFVAKRNIDGSLLLTLDSSMLNAVLKSVLSCTA